MLFEALWYYKTLQKYVWGSIPGMFKLSVIAYSVVPSKNVFVKAVTGICLTSLSFTEENHGKLPFPELKENQSQGFVLFCTFSIKKRGLSTGGKEKRGALMEGQSQGRGFTLGWEGRQAWEGPIRTSSHCCQLAGGAFKGHLGNPEI